jgi:hypothetical protein
MTAVAALAVTGIVGAGPAHHAGAARSPGGPAVVSASQIEAVLGKPSAPNQYPSAVVPDGTRPLVSDSATDVILEGVLSGELVLIIQAVAQNPKEIFEMIKNGIYKVIKGKGYFFSAPNDGKCIGGFHWNVYDREADCTDKTGIFWEYDSSTGSLYDTHTGGDMFAWGDNDGRHTSTLWPPSDWHTWTYGYICANSSCSKVYGTYWPLYNHQSKALSDGART